MINKKNIFILIISFIISIKVLILIDNNQKTRFRYFIWKTDEIEIGRLMSISFLSGLMISTILNKSLSLNVKPTKNIENQIESDTDKVDDYDDYKSEEEYNLSAEMPPQRDIRDTQPTISVNYRVIKNNNQSSSFEKNSIENRDIRDDWLRKESDW